MIHCNPGEVSIFMPNRNTHGQPHFSGDAHKRLFVQAELSWSQAVPAIADAIWDPDIPQRRRRTEFYDVHLDPVHSKTVSGS